MTLNIFIFILLLANLVTCQNVTNMTSQGITANGDPQTTMTEGFSRNSAVFLQFIREFDIDASTIIKIIDLLADGLRFVLRPPPPIPYLDPYEWWGDEHHAKDESIRPFRVNFNDSMIADLRHRIEIARPLTPALDRKKIGQIYGTHDKFLDFVKEYWFHKYDFKKREDYLNQYDHYKTNIQGLDIHFMHAYPKRIGKRKVYPVLLLHGGQTSFKEFIKVIPYLINPMKGRDYVFEAIVPSLPGHIYSEATNKTGLGYHRMAVVIHNLMQRLGYKQYFIQAGDFGHLVSVALSTLYPEDVLGFHSNLPYSYRPRTFVRYLLGDFNPSSVVEPKYQNRLYPVSKMFYYIATESGYFHFQATKVDSVTVGVDQSPSGLLAYFLEKAAVITNYFNIDIWDGDLFSYLKMEDLLDTATLYWSTKSFQTSARLYAETLAVLQDPTIIPLIENPIYVPFAAINFKHEVVYQPDTFLRDKFPNLMHSTTVEFGGHFAGQENPDILAHDFWDAVEVFIEHNMMNDRFKEEFDGVKGGHWVRSHH